MDLDEKKRLEENQSRGRMNNALLTLAPLKEIPVFKTAKPKFKDDCGILLSGSGDDVINLSSGTACQLKYVARTVQPEKTKCDMNAVSSFSQSFEVLL
jgi:hypothetical protein